MKADAMHTSALRSVTRPGILWRLPAIALLFALPGCTAQQKQGDASSYLIVDALTAAPGGGTNQIFASTLQSDVRTYGTTYSDSLKATLRLAMKDPGTVNNPTSPTNPNHITVNHYRVRFLTADGTQIGNAYESSASFTVSDVATVGPMTLVPAEAKTVSPLKDLANTANVLATQAEITFNGADQAGRAASIQGRISVNFGDWPDPGATGQPGVAAFSVSPASGLKAGQIAVFDGSGSTAAPGRVIVSYEWDFNDNTPTVTNLLPLATHSFSSPNTYTVTLTVTDSAGIKYSVQRTIIVQP